MSMICYRKVWNSAITTEDVAFLVQELKSVMQDLQEEIVECQENIDVYWERSNPDSYHGKYFFDYLNMYRDEQLTDQMKLYYDGNSVGCFGENLDEIRNRLLSTI